LGGCLVPYLILRVKSMKVFLSWSGPRSQKVAESLRDWLPDVLQVVEPWVSTTSIPSGRDFATALREELAESNFGVLCLTMENCRSPWILFEAGALGKVVGIAHVCPYLIDMEPEELPHPLQAFQASTADKKGTYKLVQAINRASPTLKLLESQLQKSFDRCWADLKPKLESPIRSLPPADQASELLLINVRSGTLLQAPVGDSPEVDPIRSIPVEVVDYTGDAPQLWSLHRVQRGYYAVVSLNTNRCLDVEGGVTAKTPGTRVHQWPYQAGDNQKWALLQQKDGSYKLKCKHSNLYLAYEGDYVAQREAKDSRSQRWWLVPVVRRS
jgi:hypothetical protein